MATVRLELGTTAARARVAVACGCALLAALVATGAHAVCLQVAEIQSDPGPHLAWNEAGDGVGGTGVSEGGDDGIGGTGLRGGTDGIGGTGLVGGTGGIGGAGAEPGSDGIGGTGLEPGADGIGGTGLRADAEGIGGTGVAGDARPLGLPGVSGMSDESLGRVRASGNTMDASLLRGTALLARIVAVEGECDGGAGLALHPDALIEEGSESIAADALRSGHVAWIETDADGGFATLVALRPIVEGPVAHVDVAAGRIEVMGEVIELAPGALIEGADGAQGLSLEAIGLGDSVVVHGVRGAGGHIEATWIALRSRSPFARVRGIALPDPSGAPGTSLRVGSVRVVTPSGAPAPYGHQVEVRGRWDVVSKALVDARLVAASLSGQHEDAGAPKGSRSGSRLHLGQWVPVSTR